jgi:hypothetical protein
VKLEGICGCVVDKRKTSPNGIMFLREQTPLKRGKRIMAKKEPEFKLEFSGNEMVTARAGLGLYGELYKSSGVCGDIKRMFPKPGSGKGYEAHWYIYPAVMTIIDGGEHLEDIARIGCDKGLRKIGNISEVPSSDAAGDWLRRDSDNKTGLLSTVNDNLTAKILRRVEGDFTLDIDAFVVLANKDQAVRNYNGEKSYMPMAGFIVEADCCIGYEFREGNVSPSTRNYEFTRDVFEKVGLQGRRVGRMRSDSAGYTAELFNYVNGQGAKYGVTVDQDAAIKLAIRNIATGGWKALGKEAGFDGDGREYAEFLHSMNKTDHSFRVVVQRWANPQRDMFEETAEYCYHGVATNYTDEEKSSIEVIRWHNGRSNSENYNKELKGGFGLRHVPCGDFRANGVWFGIVVLAYNLVIASKMFLFPKSWRRKTIRTIRYEFIHIAGKVIRRSRQLILRICSTLRETFEMYVKARERSRELVFA